MLSLTMKRSRQSWNHPAVQWRKAFDNLPVVGRVLARIFLPWHLHRPKRRHRKSSCAPRVECAALGACAAHPSSYKAQGQGRVISPSFSWKGSRTLGNDSLFQTSLKAKCQVLQEPEFMCKPRELWHRVQPEVRLCWLEKAPGERCQEVLALFISWGRTMISTWM